MEVDNTAKAYWNHLSLTGHSMQPPIIPIHDEGWSIWNGNSKIASPTTSTLYGLIQDPITQDRWVRHNRFPQHTLQNIDWTICEANMKALGFGRRRWVSKHASEQCGVGSTMVEWKFWKNSNCPRCNQPNEDTTHVLRCNGQEAKAKWDDNIKELDEKMTELDTQPELQAALLLRLTQWRQNIPLTDVNWPPEVTNAIHAQDAIGWKPFIEGVPSSHWQQVQQQHYDSIDSTKTGRRWLIAILKKLNQTAWDQWEHRNGVLHGPNSPRTRAMIKALDDEILAEWVQGPHDLPARDRHHFSLPLLDLINRSTKYKKAWLHNVHAARQRQVRRASQDLELDTTTPERQAILNWMRTGRTH